jgi:hypothetical protein
MGVLIDVGIVTFVSSSLSAGAGAFIGSYLKKKGESLATHEDIKMLVDQVRIVTQATKEIEAKISNEIWNRQRQWELRRDAVYSVMQAMGQAEAANVDLAHALKARQKSEDPSKFLKVVAEMSTKSHGSMAEFEKKRTLAYIVCNSKFANSLHAVFEEMQEMVRKLGVGDLDGFKSHASGLAALIAMALVRARQELGIQPYSASLSNGSSAAPSLDSQAP